METPLCDDHTVTIFTEVAQLIERQTSRCGEYGHAGLAGTSTSLAPPPALPRTPQGCEKLKTDALTGLDTTTRSPAWAQGGAARRTRCSFGRNRRPHRFAPNAGMQCGLPVSYHRCERWLGSRSIYVAGADTSKPPSASANHPHRSGDRRASSDIHTRVPGRAESVSEWAAPSRLLVQGQPVMRVALSAGRRSHYPLR